MKFPELTHVLPLMVVDTICSYAKVVPKPITLKGGPKYEARDFMS